jgi:hypothetical protein
VREIVKFRIHLLGFTGNPTFLRNGRTLPQIKRTPITFQKVYQFDKEFL